MNKAFGKWTEEETNWSQKDTDLVTPILSEIITESLLANKLKEILENEK